MSKFKIGDTVFYPLKVSHCGNISDRIIQFRVTQIDHDLIIANGELKMFNLYVYTEINSLNDKSHSCWIREDHLFESFEEAVKQFGNDVFKSLEKFELESLV